MTSTSWLEELNRHVADASARIVSSFAHLTDERARLGRALDQITSRLGRAAEAREKTLTNELQGRVLGAFRHRRFNEMSPREQRFAARMFDQVSPGEMKDFLAVHPLNWRPFAEECLKRWDAFVGLSDRSGYTRLLSTAPDSVSILHAHGRPQDIVDQRGHDYVARLLSGDDLRQARASLQQRGFSTAWAFSALSLSAWAWSRIQRGMSFDRAWTDVIGDLESEAMLLPKLKGQLRSWFSERLRPARVRGGINAHAMFIAALLRAAERSRAGQGTAFTQLTEGLLQSEFGDPRIPPESAGWVRLREMDAHAHQRFLEMLISEDLTVFFEHAMTDLRRKHFWLRYLKSVRRTVCILYDGAHAALTRKLAGADPKLAAAVGRARRFRRRGANDIVQAFCLYFDSVVIVEYSATGNAAQIYDRGYFERELEPDIYANACSDHAVLKSGRHPDSASRGRILHMGAHWEDRADRELAELGIWPA